MSGIYNGVAAIILRKSKNAYFVHYNAHCLDLVLQDLTRDSVVIDKALSITKDIVQFVRKSPKRLNIAKKLSIESSTASTNLKPLCPTRWTVRASSMNSLLMNYQLTKSVMQELVEDKGEPSIKAAGWLNQMEKFQTYFGLKLGKFMSKIFHLY